MTALAADTIAVTVNLDPWRTVVIVAIAVLVLLVALWDRGPAVQDTTWATLGPGDVIYREDTGDTWDVMETRHRTDAWTDPGAPTRTVKVTAVRSDGLRWAAERPADEAVTVIALEEAP